MVAGSIPIGVVGYLGKGIIAGPLRSLWVVATALIAWSAVMVEGHVAPGKIVLVQGTGGVSTFALVLAHAAGAKVIVTSSGRSKIEKK